MFEIIITCLFLAALPVLLFSIPKTRRMTGSWITAWKTVPLGCLVTFLIPTLVYETVKIMRHFFELLPVQYFRQWPFQFGLAGFGLVFGILTIISFSRWIWRKYHAEGKRSWLPFPVVFFVFAIGTVVLSILFLLFHLIMNVADYRDQWEMFELPMEKKVQIAFEQCGLHPFLAEYNYRFRFKRDGKTEYRNLQTNTGGRTYFNVYRLKDGRLYFVDKDSRYIVDPSKEDILYVHEENKRFWAVPYPQEKITSWGWNKEESGKMIFEFNNSRIEAKALSDELDGKVYYGCITNDFYSAKEKKEHPISK